MSRVYPSPRILNPETLVASIPEFVFTGGEKSSFRTDNAPTLAPTLNHVFCNNEGVNLWHSMKRNPTVHLQANRIPKKLYPRPEALNDSLLRASCESRNDRTQQANSETDVETMQHGALGGNGLHRRLCGFRV